MAAEDGSEGEHPLDESPSRKERSWAVVRIVLGQTQMIGAVAGICLLLATGLNAVTLTVVGVTCGLTVVSKLVFGWSKDR